MAEPISAWQRQWPEVLASLDVTPRKAVPGALANHALEGMEPDRESITNLGASARGDIGNAEYNRRAGARAARMTGAAPPGYAPARLPL